VSGSVGGRERRRHIREKKRLQVRFGPGDLAHAGQTQDISESSLCLQAAMTYPPKTILVLQIEYPEGAMTVHGIVRWSRDLPPAFRQKLRGIMGVEFIDDSRPGRPSEAAGKTEPAPPIRPVKQRRGAPADAADTDLVRYPARRRQLSTRLGNTFEVREIRHGGATHVRIFQLPLTDGSHEAVFREAFWTQEEADEAIKAFLKDR